MIYFDQTSAGRSRHQSGLMRVSARLADAMGTNVVHVRWPEWNRRPAPEDWYFTPELFSEAERPGITDFLRSHACRSAAVFHDAIPLRFPHITWPKSVARHPGYLKLLADFDRIWAVSAESKRELLEYWRWLGLQRTPLVEVLPLGADFDCGSRGDRRSSPRPETTRLLCLGIIEPRKNQAFLLDVCSRLWSEGLKFELHLIGRTNPHFGAPIMARARELARQYQGAVVMHGAVTDAELLRLYASARATVFPTIAEGCGLPLIESLWRGVPCVCSDLPALQENAMGGGCVSLPVGDLSAWRDALRRLLTDEEHAARLNAEAATRSLPTWHEAAATLLRALVPPAGASA